MALQTIEPEVISLEGFPKGWMPDIDEAVIPLDALKSINNLLPDKIGSGALATRKGYKRISSFSSAGHKAASLHSYGLNLGAFNEIGKQYLIVTVRDNTASVGNVQLHYILLNDMTTARIDPAGVRQWKQQKGKHWGDTVNNCFYGGSETDPVYSWMPYYNNGVLATLPYDPDATMAEHSTNTWTTSVAYVVGDRVKDGSWVWVCINAHTSMASKQPKDGWNSGDYWQRSAKFAPLWVTATSYAKGDKVAYLVTGNQDYPRGLVGAGGNRYSTFVANRAHTSDGTTTPPSWIWDVDRAARTNVGLFHANRLFLRDDDAGTSRVRYSGPVKPTGLWDSNDWTSSDVQGSGFFDVRSMDGDDVRAFNSLGKNLIILKRRSCHVLAGTNPSVWSLNQIGDVGCLYKRAVVEHEGLCYFLSDQGLFATDGATVMQAPGTETFTDWFRDNVDLDGTGIYNLSMKVFDNRIWMSLPTGDGSLPKATIVYDPIQQTLYKLDMATYQFAVNRINRIDELFFTSTETPGLVFQYDQPDAADTDDTGLTSYANQAIPWHARFGWMSFGTAKEDRKVRRVWAAVRASSTVTLKAYKNFASGEVWSVSTALTGLQWVEGKIIQTAHAVSLRLEGTTSPATIMGLGLHTQFRRKRYHRQ